MKKGFLAKAFEEEYSISKDNIEHMFNIVEGALDEGINNVIHEALSGLKKLSKKAL